MNRERNEADIAQQLAAIIKDDRDRRCGEGGFRIEWPDSEAAPSSFTVQEDDDAPRYVVTVICI